MAQAAFFEAAAKASGQPKAVANWLMGEVARRQNAAAAGGEGVDAALPITPAQLSALVSRIADGTISHNAGRQVFDALWTGAATDVDALIEQKGLRQMRDDGALEAIVAQVVAGNPKSIDEYRAGKDKALNALVGQAMKASGGKADPNKVRELLLKAIG